MIAPPGTGGRSGSIVARAQTGHDRIRARVQHPYVRRTRAAQHDGVAGDRHLARRAADNLPVKDNVCTGRLATQPRQGPNGCGGAGRLAAERAGGHAAERANHGRVGDHERRHGRQHHHDQRADQDDAQLQANRMPHQGERTEDQSV